MGSVTRPATRPKTGGKHDDQKRQGQHQARRGARLDRMGSSTRPKPPKRELDRLDREPPANPAAATKPPAHIITSVS